MQLGNNILQTWSFFFITRGEAVFILMEWSFALWVTNTKQFGKMYNFVHNLKKKLKFQAYSFFLHIQLIRNVPDVKMHAFLTFSELHDKINPSGMF